MGAAGSVNITDDNTNKQLKQNASEFLVSYSNSKGFKLKDDLPSKFVLQINKESLDFLRCENHLPIIQFPFQNIICWGHNSLTFRFNLFGNESIGGQDVSIAVATNCGEAIQKQIMSTILKLMAEMEKRTISKEEFSTLQRLLVDSTANTLQENWIQTVTEFSCGRAFLAKQCMDLINLVGPLAPFEKLDFACLLYTRILNRDQFQLVVNTFEDVIERENLLHRLQIECKQSTATFVTDCKILSDVSLPMLIDKEA